MKTPGNIIYKTKTLDYEYKNSNIDSEFKIKGIYIQTPETILNIGYQKKIYPDKSVILYELRYFLEECINGNFEFIKMLYSDNKLILQKHTVFNSLDKLKKEFITKNLIYNIKNQINQLNKKCDILINELEWFKSQLKIKTPLDFCYKINERVNDSMLLKYWFEVQYPYERRNHKHFMIQKIKNCPNNYHLYYDSYSSSPKGILNISNNKLIINNSKIKNLPDCMIYFNENEYNKYYKKHNNFKKHYKLIEKEKKDKIILDKEFLIGKYNAKILILIDTLDNILRKENIIIKKNNSIFLERVKNNKDNRLITIQNIKNRLYYLNNLIKKSNISNKVNIKKVRKSIYLIRSFYDKIENKKYSKKNKIGFKL